MRIVRSDPEKARKSLGEPRQQFSERNLLVTKVEDRPEGDGPSGHHPSGNEPDPPPLLGRPCLHGQSGVAVIIRTWIS